MRSAIWAIVLTAALGGPCLTGCDSDKTTSTKTSETTHSDGSTTVDKSKTTIDSNGNRTQETEHKTNP